MKIPQGARFGCVPLLILPASLSLSGRCQPAQLGTGALLGARGASIPIPHPIPHPKSPGCGFSRRTGMSSKREDFHSESCRLRGIQTLLLTLPSSWGPPRPDSPPCPPPWRLFQPGFTSKPCAPPPATWCLGRLCQAQDSDFPHRVTQPGLQLFQARKKKKKSCFQCHFSILESAAQGMAARR